MPKRGQEEEAELSRTKKGLCRGQKTNISKETKKGNKKSKKGEI